MTSQRFLQRINNAQKKLDEIELDMLWVEDPKDLYYYSGLEVSRGVLLLLKDAAYLVLDGRYFSEARDRSPIEVLLEKQGYEEILLSHIIEKIGLDFSFTTLERFKKIQTLCDAEYIACSLTKELRAIKDEYELQMLQQSADLLWEGFEYLQGLLRNGLSESELAWKFESYVREKGAQALSFDPILAYDSNSAFAHYTPQPIVKKTPYCVLVDIGVVLNKYCSDMTRTIVYEHADAKLKEIHTIVYEAYLAAVEHCKIGVDLDTIDAAARQVIEAAGYGEYFIHSLGHGVGLDVHELPSISKRKHYFGPLQEHMVFTIEPGIYLPGLGGVRYENTLYMTKKGPISFFPNDNS